MTEQMAAPVGSTTTAPAPRLRTHSAEEQDAGRLFWKGFLGRYGDQVKIVSGTEYRFSFTLPVDLKSLFCVEEMRKDPCVVGNEGPSPEFIPTIRVLRMEEKTLEVLAKDCTDFKCWLARHAIPV